jgi:hypothetical protein
MKHHTPWRRRPKSRVGVFCWNGVFLFFVVTLGGAACSDDDSGTAIDATVDSGTDSAVLDATTQDGAEPDNSLPPDADVPDGTLVDGGPFDCRPAATQLPDGYHQPGTDCMICHANMSGNLAFTVSGTLYDGVDSNTPVSGATVTLVDDGEQVLDVVTAENGNFYTAEPVTFPLRVWVSRCPDVVEKTVLVQDGGGGCNSCHGSGNRIHLP